MKNTKIISGLTLLMILLNGIVYYLSEENQNQRIQIALNENIAKLKTHYDILLYNQKETADLIYKSTMTMVPRFIEIYKEIQTASVEQKNILRKELYEIMKVKYKIIKEKGVLQYQFVLPNNESFLRMHKPDKFGDNLTSIRKDFKYVNDTKKPIRGFVQGRTTHAFRNTYPILDKQGNHLGALEISFPSESIQKYLTKVSKIHTHFLVHKDIFDAKTWKRDDLVLKYFQSSEHQDFMFAMNEEHTKELCIIDNNKKLQPLRREINLGIDRGNKFAIYTLHDRKHDNKDTHNLDKHVDVVAFYPIKDISNKKTLAWLVSYEDNEFIYNTLKTTTEGRVIFFLIFLFIAYLLFRQIKIQEKIKLDHILLNSVLNSTDNIMFVTDFKLVTFANRKFRDFFNINNEEEFNTLVDNNLINIFISMKGYLHHELLKSNENLFQLIKRTNHEDRVVCILDKSINTKAFYINMTQVHYGDNDEYLVTLTDITKFKEKEVQIEKKAYIDGLTQVYNRNKFDEVALLEISKGEKANFSIALIDIDHFKNFNDTYGHLVGDEVLIALAQTIDMHVKKIDTFARWGGEEFVILLPDTSKENAKIVCEQLRRYVENIKHKTAGGITASFGVAQYCKNDTLEMIFKRCDDALYEAKENGRNMVCVK